MEQITEQGQNSGLGKEADELPVVLEMKRCVVYHDGPPFHTCIPSRPSVSQSPIIFVADLTRAAV
jgi:hypothetical protein